MRTISAAIQFTGRPKFENRSSNRRDIICSEAARKSMCGCPVWSVLLSVQLEQMFRMEHEQSLNVLIRKEVGRGGGWRQSEEEEVLVLGTFVGPSDIRNMRKGTAFKGSARILNKQSAGFFFAESFGDGIIGKFQL
jgi:hypothetical protein